jgi:hypothetical protein
MDASCGDGVELGIFLGDQQILPYRRINGGDNRGQSDELSVRLNRGDFLNVVISVRDESTCDLTRVYVEIYAQN